MSVKTHSTMQKVSTNESASLPQECVLSCIFCMCVFLLLSGVNGVMFRGREFATCQSDVTFWHVVNVGTQSDFLSVYFTGNPFKHLDAHHTVLTLFPMTGETVPMEADLTGKVRRMQVILPW